MILTFAVAGYRSLREIILPLQRLNVVTGANGSGKSSFYRALRLLADAAQGRIVQSLAGEGGLRSTLWAGPEAFSRAMKSGETPVQLLILVTHARALVEALSSEPDCTVFVLEKQLGETLAPGFKAPAWAWPKR